MLSFSFSRSIARESTDGDQFHYGTKLLDWSRITERVTVLGDGITWYYYYCFESSDNSSTLSLEMLSKVCLQQYLGRMDGVTRANLRIT